MDNNIPTIDLTQDEDGDAFNQDSFQKILIDGYGTRCTISQSESSLNHQF